MALLNDVNTAAHDGDTDSKVDSVTRQVNEWGRRLTNEHITKIYNDESGTPRIIIGVLPDKTAGLVISKEGIDVTSVFS